MKKLGQIKIDFYDDHSETKVQLKNVDTINVAMTLINLMKEIGINKIVEDDCDDQKPYNAKLVCVKTEGTTNFTIGKVYEVKDGILHGNKHKFGIDPFNNEPFKNLDEINKFMAAYFIELVE